MKQSQGEQAMHRCERGQHAHLHDQVSALGQGLFSLFDRDVLDGGLQLLLDPLVGGLVQHLLKGSEGHRDRGWQVDLLG